MEMTELFTAYDKKTLTKELKTEYPLAFIPNEAKQKKIIKIANKALTGEIYFTKYIDYIKWIKNALLITSDNHNE